MRNENEVILIHYNEKPAVYGRIEFIEPDVKRDWYRATILLLAIPTQTVTWILRESYIDGSPFTMNDIPIRIEGVKKTPLKRYREDAPTKEKKDTHKPGIVIPFKKP